MPIPAIVPFLGGVFVVGGGVGIAAYIKRRKKKPGLPPSNGGALPPGQKEGQEGTQSDAAAAAEIIKPYLGSYDHAAFHRTQSGDSPAKLARKVLEKLHPGVTDQQVAAMRRALAMSAYNRQIAGCPDPAGSSYYSPGGTTINGAFLPKHEGVDVLEAGYMPRRNVDGSCNPIGPSRKWAALWVPQVNVNALKAGATDEAILFGGQWPDGSSTLEPPPAFWEAAVKRPSIGS